MLFVPDRTTVEKVVAAPAATIFALLADPTRHPELDGSGLLESSKEPSRQLTLGESFTMPMKAGPVPYTMVNEVVEFEQDRLIAWQPRPEPSWLKRVIGGRIWRYELEAVEGGTRVRETWDISQEQVKPLMLAMAPGAAPGMRRSLDRLATLVETRP